LDSYAVDIEEYEVDNDFLDKIDNSSLTTTDLNKLEKAKPVRPIRWHDYIFEDERKWHDGGKIRHEFNFVIPFAIIDNRITDLAMNFWSNPDEKLMTGYRRLEDIIRKRTGIDEHNTKLFARAFKESLGWKNINDNEQ